MSVPGSEAEVNEEFVKLESVELEAEVDKENVTVGVFDTESSMLDEILSVESEDQLQDCMEVVRQQLKEAWALSGGGERISEHFHELVPDMALEFPFELDKFQKEAIYYLEKGGSLFLWQLTNQLGRQLLRNMHLLWHQNTAREPYILLKLKPLATRSTGIFVGNLKSAFSLGM